MHTEGSKAIARLHTAHKRLPDHCLRVDRDAIGRPCRHKRHLTHILPQLKNWQRRQSVRFQQQTPAVHHCTKVGRREHRPGTCREHRRTHFGRETTLRQSLAQPFAPGRTTTAHRVEVDFRSAIGTLRQQFLIEERHPHFVDRQSLVQMFGRSGQRRVHTRIHFAQAWHQPVSHEVAAKLCIGVRAVGHIRLLQLSQKRQDLRFAHLQ